MTSHGMGCGYSVFEKIAIFFTEMYDTLFEIHETYQTQSKHMFYTFYTMKVSIFFCVNPFQARLFTV